MDLADYLSARSLKQISKKRRRKRRPANDSRSATKIVPWACECPECAAWIAANPPSDRKAT